MDLSSSYANVGGTIYNKGTGKAYSDQQSFFRDAGVNSFSGLNFDTAYKPQVNQPKSSDFLQGNTNFGATLNVPTQTPSSGLSVVHAPVGSGNYNLQGSTGTPAIPGVYQAGGNTLAAPQVNLFNANSNYTPQLNGNTDLSSKFGNYNGTVYDKSTNTPFSTPSDFFKAAGVKSFNGLKFDTSYDPNAFNAPLPGTHPANFPVQGASQNVSGASVGGQASGDSSVNIQPSPSTDSNALADGPTTNNDIYSVLSDHLKQQNALLQQLQNYAATGGMTPELQAAQQQYSQAVGTQTAAAGMQNGLYNPTGRALDLADLTGEGRNAFYGASALATQLGQQLQLAQGNRQFALQAAQQAFDAGQNNIKDTLDLYTKVAPQNIGTQYNPVTGDLFAITRNPIDGSTNVQSLGNIGPQRSYTSTNITTDPQTGGLVFVGTHADGTVDIQPIGGGSGSSGGGQTQQSSGGLPTTPVNTGLTTPAARNNNPGNLRNPDGSWQQFSSPAAGFSALVSDVQGKISGNNKHGLGPDSTLTDFFNVYAPSSDRNNPIEYARTVAQQLGTTATAKIGTLNPVQLASAIAQDEDGPYWRAVTGITQQQQAQAAPAQIQPAVRQLSDGTSYILQDLVSNNLPMAKNFSAATGIPILSTDDVQKVRQLDVTTQNLNQLLSTGKDIFASGPVNRVFNSIGNYFGKNLQTNPTIAAFNAYRDTAINTIQALAGGTGSGLRLNQGEIDTATSNIPTIYDTTAVAQQKVALVQSFLEKWKTQLLPNYQGAPTQQANSNDPLGLFAQQ